MTIQTIQPPADPGPRRWTASLATLLGEGYISGCIYGREGERYRATPVRETATGITATVEVTK